MILSKKQIIEILDRIPKKEMSIKGILNTYNYTKEEQINLIKTYINERKGIEVEINDVKGEMVPSFVKIMLSRGINPMQAMETANDYHALDFAFHTSLAWYYKKYKSEN